MPQNVSLSPKQQGAILALLSTADNTKAAQIAGVNRRTLLRWLEQPAFAHELHKAQAALFDGAARVLSSELLEAIGTLSALHKDKAQPANVRRLAASDIVSAALRLREIITLEARLSALEDLLNVT